MTGDFREIDTQKDHLSVFALSVVDSEPLFAICSSQIWPVPIIVHSESSSFNLQLPRLDVYGCGKGR